MSEQLRFDDDQPRDAPAPWYGCDLDGTLAVSDGTHALGVIGAPVPKMVERVKQALAEGKDVRIFTARIADLTGSDLETEIKAIEAFCLEKIGHVLPVTCTKDAGMVELWDDRVRQVEKNTGEFVVGRAEVQQPVAHKYGTTQADIPDGLAADAIEAVRALIADEDLAGQGKNVEGNHVTVRYGFFGNDCGSIASFLSKQKPFEAMLGKTEMFPATEHSDGAAVIKAPVTSLDLRRINAQLAEYGPFKPADFEYNPHATIAYVKPEVAEKYVGLSGTEGKIFKVDGITINKSNGQSLFVKLAGGNTTEFGPQGEPIITRYSPDQERDSSGKWTTSGGGEWKHPKDGVSDTRKTAYKALAEEHDDIKFGKLREGDRTNVTPERQVGAL